MIRKCFSSSALKKKGINSTIKFYNFFWSSQENDTVSMVFLYCCVDVVSVTEIENMNDSMIKVSVCVSVCAHVHVYVHTLWTPWHVFSLP